MKQLDTGINKLEWLYEPVMSVARSAVHNLEFGGYAVPILGLIVLVLCYGAILVIVVACAGATHVAMERRAPRRAGPYQEQGTATHEIIAEVYAGRLSARR